MKKGKNPGTSAKKSSAKNSKSGKSKNSNPVAIKHAPERAGSVEEISKVDLEEFRRRKKVSKKNSSAKQVEPGIEG